MLLSRVYIPIHSAIRMFQLCACHSDTPQYNSSETFRNVPLLLSHVCLCAVRFDGYSFPMLATKLYPLLPTTPGTANLTNFPKRKTPQSATFQSLYINKNERTLFPRFVVVGFLYSFCSSRQDFQIFFAHTVKHSIELTAARGFLLFPFREKELVY